LLFDVKLSSATDVKTFYVFLLKFKNMFLCFLIFFSYFLSFFNVVFLLLLKQQEAQLLLGDRATRKHAKDS